jgi:LPXTG-motif cell wall-anchored protein
MAGYDIGVSFSGSSSAAASINSPFNVTGGGGSGLTGSRGTPSTAAVLTGNKVLPYLAIAGVLVLLALVFFWRRK